MGKDDFITGFSKLTRDEKLLIISSAHPESKKFIDDMNLHIIHDEGYQSVYDNISENTISNFTLPYSVAPNFLINNKLYHIPMVTEESSVVAASSAAAKYWGIRGGFHSNVISTIKSGQVHFLWKENKAKIFEFFQDIKSVLLESSDIITAKMKKRGGGIISIDLVDKTDRIPFYYQINVKFETCDSMGANFINTTLENIALELKYRVEENFSDKNDFEVIMSILSSHAPENIVNTYVECNINDLNSGLPEMSPNDFARRFVVAVEIANNDVYRAVTHNKGIYNGIDAVTIATGNDFRAVEAQGHTYAVRNGVYSSLSEINTENNKFHLSITLPLTIGTVGGLTNLHPMAKSSLELLGNPSAKELMQIISSAGLANHFSAIRALITKGIQSGHMRIHLSNILLRLDASEEEKYKAYGYFKDKQVSHNLVKEFIESERGIKTAKNA